MRVIIAGGREYDDWEYFRDRVMTILYTHDSRDGPLSKNFEIVSGGATGADEMGEQFADDWCIPVRVFEADWNAHRNSAGPIRNTAMARYADALIAFWDGKSTGTRDMINKAVDQGLEIHVFRYDDS